MWKLPKLFAKRERPVPLPQSAEAQDVVDDIVAYARNWVRGGYMTRADIITEIGAMAEEEGIAPDLFDAESLVDLEIRELRAEQRHWPAVTDWDRLDAAMEALEMKSIVARQDWTCCGNCGVAEIGAELDRFEEKGVRARGYAFFHQQDTESAVEGSGIYFNYGHALEYDAPEKSRAIGWEVVEAMKGAGLKPQWDGDLGQRVFVPLDWKRRWVES